MSEDKPEPLKDGRYSEILKAHNEAVEKLSEELEKFQEGDGNISTILFDFFKNFSGDEEQMAGLTVIFIAGFQYSEIKGERERQIKREMRRQIKERRRKGGLPD